MKWIKVIFFNKSFKFNFTFISFLLFDFFEFVHVINGCELNDSVEDAWMAD